MGTHEKTIMFQAQRNKKYSQRAPYGEQMILINCSIKQFSKTRT